MGDIVTRKCGCCKEDIEININDVRDVVYFNKKYFHIACFTEMAAKKAASQQGKPEMWRDALDRICELEAKTKNGFVRDQLNQWLLEHYDVAAVSSRIFYTVNDLASGKYKGRSCKPIPASTLLECWKWCQRKLDEIAVWNKTNNKGAQNDDARLVYDLAVVVRKVPEYLESIKRHEVVKKELENNTHSIFNEIDMSKIGQTKQEKRKDISDISNDLFVE